MFTYYLFVSLPLGKSWKQLELWPLRWGGGHPYKQTIRIHFEMLNGYMFIHIGSGPLKCKFKQILFMASLISFFKLRTEAYTSTFDLLTDTVICPHALKNEKGGKIILLQGFRQQVTWSPESSIEAFLRIPGLFYIIKCTCKIYYFTDILLCAYKQI